MTAVSELFRSVGHGLNLKAISCFAIVVLALSHVLIVGAMVGENADTSSIVFATNNDASVAITVSTKTRWFNDNGWRAYGPLYYRLAHSLVKMVPYFKAHLIVPQEEKEVTHHFALMLVSFLSLLLACFLLAGLFPLSWAERIGLTSLFLSMFLLNRVFSKYVLTAHPDLLLTLLTSILFLAGYHFLRNQKQSTLISMSVVFGLMLSTKMTAILFLPGLFWVMLSPRGWKGTLINFFLFTLLSISTYFAVGVPQNFKIRETLDFLATYSQHSSVGDIASLVEWIHLLVDQFWMPAGLVLFLCLFITRSTRLRESWGKPWDRISRIKLALFGVSPLLALMTRQFNSPHDYYTIPFGILLVMTLGSLLQDRTRIGVPLPKIGWRKVFFIIAVPLLASRSNTHFATVVKEETEDRASYRRIQSWITEKARSGETVLLTSYVPMPYDSAGVVVDPAFSFEKMKDTHFSAMALNKSMYSRYLVGERPSDYVLVDFKSKDWRPVREFYSYFNEGRDVKTPDGKEWRLVREQLNIQLWEQANRNGVRNGSLK